MYYFDMVFLSLVSFGLFIKFYLRTGRAFDEVDSVAGLVGHPALSRPVFLALDRRKSELRIFGSEEYLKAIEAIQLAKSGDVVVDRVDVPLIRHHRR